MIARFQGALSSSLLAVKRSVGKQAVKMERIIQIPSATVSLLRSGWGRKRPVAEKHSKRKNVVHCKFVGLQHNLRSQPDFSTKIMSTRFPHSEDQEKWLHHPSINTTFSSRKSVTLNGAHFFQFCAPFVHASVYATTRSPQPCHGNFGISSSSTLWLVVKSYLTSEFPQNEERCMLKCCF